MATPGAGLPPKSIAVLAGRRRRRGNTGPAAATNVLTHTFTGTDLNADVTPYTADTGQADVRYNDGTAAQWGRNANRLTQANGPSGEPHIVWDAGKYNGTLTCRLSAIDSSTGLTWRGSGAGDLYLAHIVSGSNPYELRVYKKVSAAYTELAANVAVTIADGDEWGVVLNGNAGKIQIAGVDVSSLAWNDAFNATATMMGAKGKAGSTPSTRWDGLNFLG